MDHGKTQGVHFTEKDNHILSRMTISWERRSNQHSIIKLFQLNPSSLKMLLAIVLWTANNTCASPTHHDLTYTSYITPSARLFWHLSSSSPSSGFLSPQLLQ
jgi:hypothetical protein